MCTILRGGGVLFLHDSSVVHLVLACVVLSVSAVMLQPFDHSSAEKNKHKFMVQTMLAPPKFKLENLDAVVRKHSGANPFDPIAK